VKTLGTDSRNALQGSTMKKLCCCHLHSVSTVPHCAVAASGFIFLTVQMSIYPNTLVHAVQTRILSFTVWPLISKLSYNKFMILLTT